MVKMTEERLKRCYEWKHCKNEHTIGHATHLDEELPRFCEDGSNIDIARLTEAMNKSVEQVAGTFRVLGTSIDSAVRDKNSIAIRAETTMVASVMPPGSIVSVSQNCYNGRANVIGIPVWVVPDMLADVLVILRLRDVHGHGSVVFMKNDPGLLDKNEMDDLFRDASRQRTFQSQRVMEFNLPQIRFMLWGSKADSNDFPSDFYSSLKSMGSPSSVSRPVWEQMQQEESPPPKVPVKRPRPKKKG